MQNQDSTSPERVYWPENGPTGPWTLDGPEMAVLLNTFAERLCRARKQLPEWAAEVAAINAAAFDLAAMLPPPMQRLAPLRAALADWVAGGPVPESIYSEQRSRREWQGGAA